MSKRMPVTLVWSGEMSKALAQALHKLLPLVVQGIDLFASPEDIEIGEKWDHVLTDQLSSGNFGIGCLTPENLNSNWIHYECGAISKGDTGRFASLLFAGLTPSHLETPLSSFQFAEFGKEGFAKLCRSMSRAAKKVGADVYEEPILDAQLEKWWPEINERVCEVVDRLDHPRSRPRPSDTEMLERILESVRHLEREIRSAERREQSRRFFKRSRMRRSSGGSLDFERDDVDLLNQFLGRYDLRIESGSLAKRTEFVQLALDEDEDESVDSEGEDEAAPE